MGFWREESPGEMRDSQVAKDGAEGWRGGLGKSQGTTNSSLSRPRGAEQRGGGGAAADQMAPEAASGGYPGVLTLRSQYTRFCPHSCSCLEPHPHMSKHSYSLLTQPGPTAGLDSSPLGALALALRSGKDRIPKGTSHSWLSFQGLERATRARQRKGAID